MTAKEYRKSLSKQKTPVLKASNLNPPVRLYNFGPYQLFSYNQFDVPNNLNLDES